MTSAADFCCYWLLTGCRGGRRRGRPGHVRGATWWLDAVSSLIITRTHSSHKSSFNTGRSSRSSHFTRFYFLLQLSTSSLALFLLQIHNYTQNLNQPNSHFKAASILFTFAIFDRSSIRQDFARFEIRDLRSICSFLPNLLARFDFVWSTYLCWFAKRRAQIARALSLPPPSIQRDFNLRRTSSLHTKTDSSPFCPPKLGVSTVAHARIAFSRSQYWFFDWSSTI